MTVYEEGQQLCLIGLDVAYLVNFRKRDRMGYSSRRPVDVRLFM